MVTSGHIEEERLHAEGIVGEAADALGRVTTDDGAARGDAAGMPTDGADASVPRRRRRRAWRIVGWTLAVGLLLLLAMPWMLYIPAVQTYVKDRVVAWLNNGSESLQFHVGSIRLEFPLRLKVEDVMAIRDGRDTLFSFGLLETGLDDIPIGQRFFVVRHVGVEDVRFRLPDLTETLTLYGDVPALDVADISIDPSGELRVGEVTMPRPRVYVAVHPSEPDSLPKEPAAPWYIAVRRLHVSEAQVGLNLDTLELPRTVFDYNHLWLDSLWLDVSDFAINTGTMYVHADVERLNVIERRSGTQVDDLRARFTMNGTEIDVHDLTLQMPGTHLSGRAALDTRFFEPPHRGEVRIDLTGSLGGDDVRRQAGPYLPQMTAVWPDAALALAVQADANADTLRRLDTHLAMAGRFDVALRADGTLPWDDSLRSVAAEVEAALPDADFLLTAFVAPLARRAYRLPDGLAFSATASQQPGHLAARLRLDHFGRRLATAEASFNTADQSYQARASVRRLRVGAFVPSVPIGGVTARVEASGRRFDLQERRARLEATVRLDTLRWPGDSLVDLDAELSLAQNRYTLTAESGHPRVGLRAHAEGLYCHDSLTAAGQLDVRRLDLGHLPAVPESDLGVFALRAAFDAAYDWRDFARLELHVDSLLYAAAPDDDRHGESEAGRQIQLDDLSVTLHSSAEDGFYARLRGGDADLLLDVDRSIAALPDAVEAMTRELDRQLADLHVDPEALLRAAPRGTLRLDMERDNPFYPFIHYYGVGFTTAHVELSHDDRLAVRAYIEDLMEGDVGLDTLSLSIAPLDREEGYRYDIRAAYNDPKPKNSFSASGRGELRADSLTAHVGYTNGRGVRLYDFGASLALASDTLTLRLAPDPLLYAQPFTVNADNYVRVTSFRDLAERSVGTTARVEMSGPQGLELTLRTTSVPRRRGNALLLALRHVDIDYLRRTVQWEHDAGGQLDLTLTALAIPDSLSGMLSLSVGDLHVGDWRADTLSLTGRFAQTVTNRLAAPADGTAPPHRPEGWAPRFLSTAAAQLSIDELPALSLSLRVADSLRLDARMDGVPLALASVFMPPEMPLSGTAAGRLSVAGTTMEEAVIDAAVALTDASFTYADAGATLRLPADTLRLEEGLLRLDGYALSAAGGNPLLLSGTVDLRHDLTDPTLALTLKGQNVHLIRSERTSLRRQSIYGRLPIDADVRVARPVSALHVSGSVTARSGTDLIYYLPEDPLQSSSRTDQLVEFVRFAQLDRKPAKLLLGTGGAAPGGVDVDLRLSVAADAKVLVYLSADEKDKASVTGGGQLRFGSDSDGNLSLNGTYEVQDGDIEINLLPGSPIAVTKAFELEAGSTVAFSGPVDQPELNLTASQEVRCTINDITTGTRAVKFTVYAYLRGTLEDLDVEFSCAAPEDAAMQMQLSSLTAEELTKQAMNLLITQTYTGPGVTGSAGSAAANSVLNQYLQKGVESLVSQKMKHTQISVGIDSYDATGSGNTRTDYSVRISQGFFNDRMRVVVGGRLSSGGDEALGQQDNAVINDVSVEWNLKRDGSHYVRLFRKTNYESALEGEVVEMGIGYVLKREAFQFRSLFLLSDEKRRRQLLERIRLLEEVSATPPAARPAEASEPLAPAESAESTPTHP